MCSKLKKPLRNFGKVLSCGLPQIVSLLVGFSLVASPLAASPFHEVNSIVLRHQKEQQLTPSISQQFSPNDYSTKSNLVSQSQPETLEVPKQALIGANELLKGSSQSLATVTAQMQEQQRLTKIAKDQLTAVNENYKMAIGDNANLSQTVNEQTGQIKQLEKELGKTKHSLSFGALADPSNIGTDNLDVGMDLGVEFASGFTTSVGVYVPFDSFTNLGQFGDLDNYRIHGSVGWAW